MEDESDDWKQIEKLLGGAEVIDALAREHGALKRARKVRDGSQVLRLSLGYATGHSLRTTAAWSGPGTGAALCDVSLLGRLREAGDFLASVVQRLLARMAETIVVPEAWQGPPVRLVDGSLFSGPGFKGMRQRLHASFDPARQIFTAIDVTAISQGESLFMRVSSRGRLRLPIATMPRRMSCASLTRTALSSSCAPACGPCGSSIPSVANAWAAKRC